MERQRGNESGPVAQIVAAQVSMRRRNLRWSRDQLANVLTIGGRKFTADAIQKLESDQRRIDVDDLVALAAALSCDPSELLGRSEFRRADLTPADVEAIQHIVGRLGSA